MNAERSTAADWRDELLVGSTPLPNSETVRCVVGQIGDVAVVIAAWEFASHGGSFGAADADAFVAAAGTAADRGLPLITMLRSGGTRLPEGMRALVGIPRSSLALKRLRAAGVPHISVADHPTTGGVWVGIASRADVRIAVADALVGFSGPRPIAAMTGRELAAGANRAASAYDAGLVDLVVEPSGIAPMLTQVLTSLTTSDPQPASVPPTTRPEPRDAWEQVVASRTAERPDGSALLTHLLCPAFSLRGADQTVAARIGLLSGRPVLGVALAANRNSMPTPAGFALLGRAAALAGAFDLALVILVDTPGADPHTEADGLVAAIADAMTAVLETPAPTVCLVHGEGGSGGALAGAVTDVVGVGPYGWFAALGPEGAAATLRIEPDEAARLMAITPTELLSNGFADDFVAGGDEAAWIAASIDRLREKSPAERHDGRIGALVGAAATPTVINELVRSDHGAEYPIPRIVRSGPGLSAPIVVNEV